MARKKKIEDLAEKSTRAQRKKNESVFLDPPMELERVLCDIYEKLPPKKQTETPRDHSILITNIPHAPSQHVVNLKSAVDKFQIFSKLSPGADIHVKELGTNFPSNRIPLHGNRSQSNAQIPIKKTKNVNRLQRNNHYFSSDQHYPHRLGVTRESRFPRVLSEVATVATARLLFGLARVCFRIVSPAYRLAQHFHIPPFHYPFIVLKRYSITGLTALGYALDRFVATIYRLENKTTTKKPREKSKRVSEKKENNAGWHIRGIFLLPREWQRALASFVAISFVFVLPLTAMSSYMDVRSAKDEVIAKSKLGISQALSGISLAKQSPLHAVSEFEKAGVSFGQASKELASINSFILKLAQLNPRTAKEIENGKRMVETVEKLSHAAAILGGAGDVFGSDTDLINKVSEFRVRLASVMPAIITAADNLNSINFEFLGISDKDIRAIQETLLGITHSLEEFVDFGDNFLALLGAEHSKKYLFLFQNNTELRPTGGFIGSIAEATIDRGEIKKLWVPGGGTYDLDGSLRVAVAPPYPLQLVSGIWKFRDANWFPDFPTSANKLAWFYERSGGGTVDGIVAVNASVVEDLLRILGPIEMPEYEKTITADNFMIETQKAVELEYDKGINQPKKFIADLAPRFLEKLGSAFGTNYLEILDIFMQNIRTRDIQLAFRDDRIQEKMYEYDWAGHIKDVPEGTDYLAVIHTNIAGMKSDARMKQRIVHRSEIQNDGTVEDTVVIVRAHTGEKGELFSGVQNVDYARIYVPEGSVLLEASGFTQPAENFFERQAGVPFDQDIQNVSGSFAVHTESGTFINNEFNKTVFGNWVLTEPGKESTVILRYRLPWKLSTDEDGLNIYKKGGALLKYGLLVQKQSGIESEFTTELQVYNARKLLDRHPDSWKGDENHFEVRDILDGDKFYSLLLQ